MKNILKNLTLIAVAGLMTVACSYEDSKYDTEFEKLTDHSPDSNSPYYVQLKANSINLEVEVNPATGETVNEIQSTINARLLGLPLSQDLTVNLAVDPASTATPNMYTLASTTIVIPAGSVSGSTTFTSVSANMPVGTPVTLIVNLDAGANNAPTASKLTFTLLRPAPCLPQPGVYTIQMADSYGDGWQTNSDNGDGITLTLDGVVVAEVGMCSPYGPSDFPCSGTPATSGFNSATATVTIPEGTLSAVWYFPGDAYGEIGFTILAPDGSVAYRVNIGEGVEGEFAIDACL